MLNRRLEQIRSRATPDVAELINEIQLLKDALHLWLKRVQIDQLTAAELYLFEMDYKRSRGEV